ncbi:hypothetical protein ACMFMG_004264 [Clarireedia jacksonii]
MDRLLTAKKKFALALAGLYDEEENDFVASTSKSNQSGGLRSPSLFLTDTPIFTDTPIITDIISDTDSIDSNSTLVEVYPAEELRKIGDKMPIRYEWTGTSIFMIDISIDIQRENTLDQLIQYRAALIYNQSLALYDPSFYIDLSQVDSKLGFSDTSASFAYRCLLLTEAGLQTITEAGLQTITEAGLQTITQQSPLSRLVYLSIAKRLNTTSPIVIIDELNTLYRKAYQWLSSALLVCGAFWDGLLTVKKGLASFPGDKELLDIKQLLTDAFRERSKEVAESGVRITASRSGKILQRRYPWMDDNLFVRSRQLIDNINSTFPSTNAKVRPVLFPTLISSTKDVGPLGIFATHTIQPDEQILLDKSLLITSNISSSTCLFCDTCHATLIPPFLHPSEIVRPKCSCLIAFCSRSCHDIATKGYHKLQCGKDFEWLYSPATSTNSQKKQDPDSWLPKMFLRLLSVILSTPGFEPHPIAQKHPLTHPLLARMTANYPVDNQKAESAFDWSFYENIQAPLKILTQLGVDIWETRGSFWGPDVLQTIYWRMENNANASVMDLAGDGIRSGIKGIESWDGKVHLTVLSPNYLFFNHCCRPNTIWHGTVPNMAVGMEWLFVEGVGRGMGGDGQFGDGSRREEEVLKPGSGSVVCRAGRVIQEGEELMISYVGDPMGIGDTDTDADWGASEGKQIRIGKEREQKRAMLTKWFENGCGCEVCEEENV